MVTPAIAASFTLLLLYAAIAPIDALYFHLWKYRLASQAESRREHGLHTARAVLFPLLLVALYAKDRVGWALLVGVGLAVVDLTVQFIDMWSERASRRQFGGLSSPEYALHGLLITLSSASLALLLAAKPASAWSWTATAAGALGYGTLPEAAVGMLIPGAIAMAVLHLWLALPTARARAALAVVVLALSARTAIAESTANGFASQPNESSMEEFSRHKKYLDVGSWRVAYIDEGSGPPLLLLHGCPFHSYEWRDLIPMLTPYYRVIAPDLLGLGDTQVRLTDDYRLPNDVTMVVGLMDALGIPDALIVGHDHGGATLQLMMRDHPERIRRAVITNAEAYDQWPSEPEKPYLRMVVSPRWSSVFRFALNHSTWVRREVFGVAVHRKEAFTDEVLAAYTRAHTATPERWARLQRFFTWQLDPAHNQVTMTAVDGMRRFEKPTLILWGRQDTNFGPALAERLAGDIPGVVGVEYLEHSAHMPFQEEPEAYGAALLRFLRADDDVLLQRRNAWRAAAAATITH